MRNYIDEYYNGDEAKSIICDAAEEITKLREQVAAQAAVIEKLLTFVKYVAEQTPEKPDYWSSCGQCSSNSDEAEDLLTIPTDNTQILEQYVKEKTQAQAAVIESLKEALHYSLGAWEYDGVSDEHGSIFKEANNRCDIPNDSTQILDEVRRAERELQLAGITLDDIKQALTKYSEMLVHVDCSPVYRKHLVEILDKAQAAIRAME